MMAQVIPTRFILYILFSAGVQRKSVLRHHLYVYILGKSIVTEQWPLEQYL